MPSHRTATCWGRLSGATCRETKQDKKKPFSPNGHGFTRVPLGLPGSPAVLVCSVPLPVPARLGSPSWQELPAGAAAAPSPAAVARPRLHGLGLLWEQMQERDRQAQRSRQPGGCALATSLWPCAFISPAYTKGATKTHGKARETWEPAPRQPSLHLLPQTDSQQGPATQREGSHTLPRAKQPPGVHRTQARPPALSPSGGGTAASTAPAQLRHPREVGTAALLQPGACPRGLRLGTGRVQAGAASRPFPPVLRGAVFPALL